MIRMVDEMESCCICGQPLPNRFAVAGRCEGAGCEAVFCALHWRNGNRRCPEHGWKPKGLETAWPSARVDSGEKQEPLHELEKPPMNQEPKSSKVDAQKVKKVLVETFSLLKRAGGGAVELLRKLKKDKSPAAMLKNIEESADANRTRREEVSLRVKALHKEILEKKKAFATASPMQKRILEKELGARIAEYEAAERELTVLLENERVLSQVKGRLMEVSSYGMAGVDEDRIEELIDDVEDAVAAAEGRVGAARDLEKAGRRREPEDAHDDLMDKLAMFGDEEDAGGQEEPAGGFSDEEPPAPESRKPEAAPPEN